jgi:hypothetical protein
MPRFMRSVVECDITNDPWRIVKFTLEVKLVHRVALTRSTVKEGLRCMSGCHVINHRTTHVIVSSCSCTTCTHKHTHTRTNTHTHAHTHTHTRAHQDLDSRVYIHPSETEGPSPLPTFSPSFFSPNKERRWERGVTLMTSERVWWT